jgi:uncharacterized DUF497 family protein
MGRTIISSDERFEWDEDKDRLNIQNHGFSFAEILDVFDDPAFFEGYDLEHSDTEDRYFGIGCVNGYAVVVAFYTERGSRTRIFSVRRANGLEEAMYYDNIKSLDG